MESTHLSDPTLNARLHNILKSEADSGFSGAIRVQKRHTIFIDSAVGSIHGVQMTPTTRFWIASIGKQFTSTALFACQDKKLVNMDDPLSRFLRSVPPDKRKITLRQLLAHQSGLPQSYIAENAVSRAEAITGILKQPLAASPGTRFIYSNNNYQLAAAILEIVTNQSYRTFVQTELLGPSGLTDTDLVQAGQDASVAPTLHALPVQLQRHRWGQQGWYSTTGDLARWFEALQTGKLLSEQSLTEMFEPLAPIQEGSATPGWYVGKTSDGEPLSFIRGNEDFGANGLLYAYPKPAIVVVILTHAGDNDLEVSYSRVLHSAVERALFSD